MNHYPQQFQTIQVACHSGHSYADCPISFMWNGERYDIVGVERE